MTILAPHFCTQQTVTLNDTNRTNPSFGLQPVTIISWNLKKHACVLVHLSQRKARKDETLIIDKCLPYGKNFYTM